MTEVIWNIPPAPDTRKTPPFGRPILVKFVGRIHAVTVEQVYVRSERGGTTSAWFPYGIDGQIRLPKEDIEVEAWAEIPEFKA